MEEQNTGQAGGGDDRPAATSTTMEIVVAAVLGTIGAGIVLSQILSFILQKVGMSGTLTGESIRPAIFALTLIVLMLLQPQGIFAHHEFSWNWLRGLFSKRSAA